MAFDGGCKIDVITERYGLDAAEPRYETVDERLLARWTGSDGRPADGYRTLTDWFNRRLLARVYERHGRDALPTRIVTEYEALTGDDDLLRREVADDLRADGIDPESLRADMPSWSTMRHHLTGCLDGRKERATAESDWERQSVEIARDHARGKVADAVSSLSSKGQLPGADAADLDVQVLLSCPECPARVSLSEALTRGYVCSTHLGTADR